MTAKSVLVVGAGERVRDAALPAFATLEERWRVDGIFSRSKREIEAGGRTHAIEPLEALDAARVRAADLIYLVVAKPAVPEVLARLAALDPSGTDLLIETPVLRFKDVGRAGLLAAFRRVHVSEDCTELPCFDAVRALGATDAVGELRCAALVHAGYAYHGVAMLKTLLGARRVAWAGRKALGRGFALRELRFAGGKRGLVFEPRDYAAGHLVAIGRHGAISDRPFRAPDTHRLEAVVEDGACRGFRAGDRTTALAPEEVELMGAPCEGTGVFAWMEGMKRVGFRRLLARLHAGEPVHGLEDGLDDMVVDYHLEKLGGYVANPLTSARSPLLRPLMRAVSRVARG